MPGRPHAKHSPFWMFGILLGLACGFVLGQWALSTEAPQDPRMEIASERDASRSTTMPAQARSATPGAPVAGAFSSSEWDAQWSQLFSAPASPTRDAALARALEEMAAVDSPRALQLADAETHAWRRQALRHAALRGWARADPAAAGEWAARLPAGDREVAIKAVLEGAAARPDEAVLLAQTLCEADPLLAGERGLAAISALAQVGAFDWAARFAQATNSPHRATWLAAAFARWGENQPRAAADAALVLDASAERHEALHAVIVGWAQTEPAELAAFSRRLPAGDDRTYALGEALRQWIEQDPVNAATWIDHFEPTPDLDEAVAAIATQPYLAARRPEVAVSWAESITEPNLRSATLARIVRDWADRDRAAARRYVEASSNFGSLEKTDLLNNVLVVP